MRSKTPLALIEQAVMVLVFALAAALCLRVFVWSDQNSKRSEARDQAVTLAQTAAELMKHEGAREGDVQAVFAAVAEEMGGSCRQSQLSVAYDKNWTARSDAPRYLLTADALSPAQPGLVSVHISVAQTDRAEPDVLFAIDVAWQEVD